MEHSIKYIRCLCKGRKTTSFGRVLAKTLLTYRDGCWKILPALSHDPGGGANYEIRSLHFHFVSPLRRQAMPRSITSGCLLSSV
jgi:hypothetical protein